MTTTSPLAPGPLDTHGGYAPEDDPDREYRNARRRAARAARRAGATQLQWSAHGAGRTSLQGFDAAGALVYDLDW